VGITPPDVFLLKFSLFTNSFNFYVTLCIEEVRITDMFNDKFIEEHSKKIFAFAYNKTGDVYDAEDLSQDILMALFTSIPKYAKIENLDAFIYTICYHCWSNFVRKHKKHWHHADIDDMQYLSDDTDVQEEVENAIFIRKMKHEIAYLSKLHRDIITMTYYDGKSSSQISRELNISDSTIRWHLVEIRKKLKGRIEMNNENINYKPISLRAGWSGRSGTNTRGVGYYRLVDNICYACYGKPLTVEEIAQKLSVAAAFIEPHLEELVFMDYMTVTDNKYQTQFFIRTNAFLEIAEQYNYDCIKNIAVKLYDALDKRYDDIKAINFTGSDLDKDFLMWIFLPFLIRRMEWKANEIIMQNKEYFYCMPKRKDGSENWLRAFLNEEDYVSPLSDDVIEFGKKSNVRWCDPWIPNEILSLQVMYYATEQAGGRYDLREREMRELSRILEIIGNDIVPDNFDKTLIARYIENGCITADDGKISMMIPYLKKAEYEKFDEIMHEIETELGDDYFVDYIEGYMKKMKKFVPDFLPENEKNYVATGISCVSGLPYHLADIGKLRYPTDEEAKRLGIIIWEVK